MVVVYTRKHKLCLFLPHSNMLLCFFMWNVSTCSKQCCCSSAQDSQHCLEQVCVCSKTALLHMSVMCCRTDSPLYEFLESCLRHKSEMVIYEAAHAIVNMKATSAKELAPAVSVLQLFCGSSKPTLRFAAVRTLNKVKLHSHAMHWQLTCFTQSFLIYFSVLLSPSQSGCDNGGFVNGKWPKFVNCGKAGPLGSVPGILTHVHYFDAVPCGIWGSYSEYFTFQQDGASVLV